MLSSVLRSPRAVQVNIAIMRAFVRLRRMLTTNESLARKLDAIERKYDAQFKVVFDAIRQLIHRQPPGVARSAFAHGPAGTTWADYGLNRTGDHNLTKDHSGVKPRASKSGRGRQVNIVPARIRRPHEIAERAHRWQL